METRVLRDLASASASKPVFWLASSLMDSVAAEEVLAWLSSTDDVTAAPRYGQVLTTTLSPKGVPVKTVRQCACLRFGTSAVWSEQLHCACLNR